MAVIPALFLVRYFYKKDNLKPEPKGLIRKIFLLGILSTIPAIILELLVTNFKDLFTSNPIIVIAFEAFIVAGLCEEWIKYKVVYHFAYKRSEFDEIMDGIVYTVVASLGFACMENVLYVINGGINVALMRAFTAVPMHAFTSGIMGYYIGQAKFDEANKKKYFRKGLIIAILIHGFYNFLLLGSPVFSKLWGETAGGLIALGVIPLLIILFIHIKKLMIRAKESDRLAGRV